MNYKFLFLVVSIALTLPAGAQNTTTVELVCVGGTFPAPIYTRWFEEYGRTHRSVHLHYLAAGSIEGVRQTSDGASDFGGTDVPVTSDELAKASTKMLLLPSVLGGVVPIYNLPGITKELRFTPEVLAGIYLGTLRGWDDPAIAAANPGVTLPNQRIDVIYRGEASGTTFIWTDYLSKVSSRWQRQVGRGVTVKWPNGKASPKGNGGLAKLVKETPYSIGYVELSFALQNHVPFGSVRNTAGEFIKASLNSLSAAAASKAKSVHGEDFRVSLTNASGESAYPIASFTWLLIPTQSLPPAKRVALKEFLQWMLMDGQAFTSDLGYAQLPVVLIEMERGAVAKL